MLDLFLGATMLAREVALNGHFVDIPRPGVRDQWSSSPHLLALMNDGFWRKAVGRINDLIGSSELVYSKVIRPPIGMLDADQGTQSAL